MLNLLDFNFKDGFISAINKYKKIIFLISIIILLIIGIPSAFSILSSINNTSNNRAYLQQEIKVLNEYQSFLSNDSYQATMSTEERNQLSSITEKASNMMIAPQFKQSVENIISSMKNYNELNQEQKFAMSNYIQIVLNNLNNKLNNHFSVNLLSIIGISIAVVGLITIIELALKHGVV